MHLVIHGDVIMNEEFKTAIIQRESFPKSEYYSTELKPTLDIKFDPSKDDFTGYSWGNGLVPSKGKYKLVNGLWVSVTENAANKGELTLAIADARTKVEANFTGESWIAADLINEIKAADLIAKNAYATQDNVDEAVKTITDAEAKLVIDLAVSQDISFVSSYDPNFNVTSLKSYTENNGVKLVIGCTSPINRMVSLFNPPSGDKIMKVYNDKIETGENTAIQQQLYILLISNFSCS